MECQVMRMAKRAILRLALVGWLGLSGFAGLEGNSAQAAAPPERVLPDSTVFFLKVNDIKALREAFRQSQYGQLWNDPAMKDFRDDIAAKLKDTSNRLKDKIGVTLSELLDIPQGTLAVAAVTQDDPKLPIALAIIADAGMNTERMNEVMIRSTRQAEEAGGKVKTEPFHGGTVHVIEPTAPKEKKPKDKDEDAKPKDEDAKPEPPRPPVVWSNAGTLFYIGSSVNLVKDLLSNHEGRSTGSLASLDSFVKTQAKTSVANSQVFWREQNSDAAEQVREAYFEALRYLFYVYQRDVSDSALDAAVIRPV